jgi:phosphohistidine phosphatase
MRRCRREATTAVAGEPLTADSPRLRLYIAHHGDAVAPQENPMRPLSLAGQQQVADLARAAAARGARPRVFWHSGKLRARQTAEAYWRACNPLAQFTAARGLLPADPASWIADRLIAEDGEVMVVGHMPHLPRLLRLLLAGDADASSIEFPMNGLVCIEEQAGAWSERWRLSPPAR